MLCAWTRATPASTSLSRISLVRRELPQAGVRGVRVPRLHQQNRVATGLRHAAHRRRDDRQPSGEGLEQDLRQAFRRETWRKACASR
jgi:hypothetical protein